MDFNNLLFDLNNIFRINELFGLVGGKSKKYILHVKNRIKVSIKNDVNYVLYAKSMFCNPDSPGTYNLIE